MSLSLREAEWNPAETDLEHWFSTWSRKMVWVYWLVGVLWVVDGFLYFVAPRFVKLLLIKSYRNARTLTVSAGPVLMGLLLVWASVPSRSRGLLVSLGVLSLVQGIALFVAVRTPYFRLMGKFVAVPDAVYRFWGLALTFLGPYLIHLRP